MNNTKKRRFPTDRMKLHALLEKREQDYLDLQDELKDLRAAVTEADHMAIHSTAEAYSVTPDMLGELLSYIQSGKPVPPELAARLTPINTASAVVKERKEAFADDDDDETEA